MTAYPKLLEEGYIGKLKLKNRILMAPMRTFTDNKDGSFSETQAAYYEARAKGGVSMIISETQFITNKTDPWIDYMSIADTDTQMKNWEQFANIVHKYNAKLCLQFNCGMGRLAFPYVSHQMVSASAVYAYYFPDMICRPLEISEIKEIIACYGRAAKRAVNAGVDAIEINAHCGFLLDQFMTPIWNRREDEYGGSFHNRMRFLEEAYHIIRNEAGDDFPIIVRMAAYHDFPGGRTIDESIEIAQYLENLGVDALDINIGCYEKKIWAHPSYFAGASCIVNAAYEIKKAIKIPVLNAGCHIPESAEKSIRSGKIDFAMFGRGLVADANFPNKINENRQDDIRPCLFCNDYCIGNTYQGRYLTCAVNARVSHEKQYPMYKTAEPKKVAVIGGGAGGLEAARVASKLGHKVTLFERSDKLGGKLSTAEFLRFKGRVREYLKWQKVQVVKHGVAVFYNVAITENSPQLSKFDQIIIAIGANQYIPQIQGITNDNVLNVTEVEENPSLITGDNIIVAGGGLTGCECALELSMRGFKVTIAEKSDMLAYGVLLDTREPLIEALNEYGVKILTNHKVMRFTHDGIIAETPSGEKAISCDTTIYSFGSQLENKLVNKIRSKYPSAIAIGDCISPSKIGNAVRKGFFAAYGITNAD